MHGEDQGDTLDSTESSVQGASECEGQMVCQRSRLEPEGTATQWNTIAALLGLLPPLPPRGNLRTQAPGHLHVITTAGAQQSWAYS